MGKSSPSTPQPPDPQQLAAAQAQANKGTARVQQRLNMIDEDTPWYSTNYTYLGDRNRNPDGTTKPPPTATDPNRSASSGATPHYDDTASDNAAGVGPQTRPYDDAPSATADNDDDPLDGEAEYWNQDRYKRSISLNPEDQKILDQQRRLTQGIGGMAEGQIPKIKNALDQTVTYDGLPQNVTGVDYNTLQKVNPNFQSGQIQSSLDFSGLPGLKDGGVTRSVNPDGQWSYDDVGGPQRSLNIQDPTAFTKGVNDTLYSAASSRFEPEIAQARDELRQSLADRGIPEDSPAAQRELNRFDQSASDTRLQASASATDRAAAQAAQLFGMDLSKFSAENAAQNQSFGQTAMQRGDLLNQGLSLADFTNRAQAQDYGQSLSTRQQLANELTTQGEFANNAQQQGFGQDAARQQLALQLRQQGLSEQEVNAALAADARQRGYQERQNVRTQPITDAIAMLGAA